MGYILTLAGLYGFLYEFRLYRRQRNAVKKNRLEDIDERFRFKQLLIWSASIGLYVVGVLLILEPAIRALFIR